MTCFLSDVVAGSGNDRMLRRIGCQMTTYQVKNSNYCFFNFFPCYNTVENERIGCIVFNKYRQLWRSIFERNWHKYSDMLVNTIILMILVCYFTIANSECCS
jgi:hypothetical protein